MSSGLLQVFVELRNLHRTSNYVLYWIHGGPQSSRVISRTLVGGVLPLCRDAVGVCSNPLYLVTFHESILVSLWTFQMWELMVVIEFDDGLDCHKLAWYLFFEHLLQLDSRNFKKLRFKDIKWPNHVSDLTSNTECGLKTFFSLETVMQQLPFYHCTLGKKTINSGILQDWV